MSRCALRADGRQLILEALDRQHDDLRRKAASRQLAGERYASLRTYYRQRAGRSAQLATELARLPFGDYVVLETTREVISGLGMDVRILARELYGLEDRDPDVAVRAADRMTQTLATLRGHLVAELADSQAGQ